MASWEQRLVSMVERFSGPPDRNLHRAPEGWSRWPEVWGAHRIIANRFIDAIPDYPEDRFKGRGIVICGGGQRYFTCAWVCINALRDVLKCSLPIELWYLGERELDGTMRKLAESLKVTCRDATEMAGLYPARILNGWELKPYAILHSAFEEVLLLDADNVPVEKPDRLFDDKQYKKRGAVFWPDHDRFPRDHCIWKACGVPYRNERRVESGQILVNKSRCWRPLNLAMHYNEHSDFYYTHTYGDKDTFPLAFRRLNVRFGMPDKPVEWLRGTMCQHDFGGRRLFQHRHADKWLYSGGNLPVPGFKHEAACRTYLDTLRKKWPGRVHWDPKPGDKLARLQRKVADTIFRYERIGYDSRPLHLMPGGVIGEGAAGCERYWSVCEVNGESSLVLHGDHGPTCRLVEGDGGAWRGRWYDHETMPVELKPL